VLAPVISAICPPPSLPSYQMSEVDPENETVG
jgi:hypothetical protein